MARTRVHARIYMLMTINCVTFLNSVLADRVPLFISEITHVHSYRVVYGLNDAIIYWLYSSCCPVVGCWHVWRRLCRSRHVGSRFAVWTHSTHRRSTAAATAGRPKVQATLEHIGSVLISEFGCSFIVAAIHPPTPQFQQDGPLTNLHSIKLLNWLIIIGEKTMASAMLLGECWRVRERAVCAWRQWRRGITIKWLVH